MRKLFLLCTVLLLLAAAKVSAASIYEKPVVAVLPYRDKAAVSQYFMEHQTGEMNRISEYVVEKLIDTGKFRVEEREYMLALVNEYENNASGFIDEDTAVRLGRQIGVQYLVAGSLTNLSTKESEAGYSHSGRGGAGFNKKAIVATITLRFIDVETGEVVLAAHGSGESARIHSEFTLKKKTDVTEEVDSMDESGVEYVDEVISTDVLEQTFTLGGVDYTLAQIDNAILHAIDRAFDDKKRGVLAKLKNRRSE